jgi:hypothetical protein
MIQQSQFGHGSASHLSAFSHLPAPCRQLNPPKSPLYRPAVLRSIERPIKRENSPLSPPVSSAASVNEEYVGYGEYKGGLDIRNAGYGYLAEDFGIAGLEEEGQVTGSPTRAHWKVLVPLGSFILPASKQIFPGNVANPKGSLPWRFRGGAVLISMVWAFCKNQGNFSYVFGLLPCVFFRDC